jgi:hypothetical protein
MVNGDESMVEDSKKKADWATAETRGTRAQSGQRKPEEREKGMERTDDWGKKKVREERRVETSVTFLRRVGSTQRGIARP